LACIVLAGFLQEPFMPVQTIVIGVAVVLAGIAVWRLAGAWLKYRGPLEVTCPENQKPAGVELNTRHAAATALGGKPELQLSACSRWPEHAGCGQECLSQIAASPEDCLVRNILVKWYAGKKCVSCGRPFEDIDWAGAKPALLTPDKKSVEWSRIPAGQLQETLSTAAPICFSCHMAATLVRERPELALDRGRGPV
jgi:hypothetical protein